EAAALRDADVSGGGAGEWSGAPRLECDFYQFGKLETVARGHDDLGRHWGCVRAGCVRELRGAFDVVADSRRLGAIMVARCVGRVRAARAQSHLPWRVHNWDRNACQASRATGNGARRAWSYRSP